MDGLGQEINYSFNEDICLSRLIGQTYLKITS